MVWTPMEVSGRLSQEADERTMVETVTALSQWVMVNTLLDGSSASYESWQRLRLHLTDTVDSAREMCSKY